MTRRGHRAAAVSIVAALILVPVLECGGAKPAAAPVAPRCPNVGDDAAVLAFDWTTFGLDAARANDMKRALAAALEMKRLAAGVDADLKTGCGGLATDLGATGDFATGTAACDAASRAIHDALAKLGKASIAIDASTPKCGAPLDVFTACAAACDASLEHGAPTCAPNELQGACTGACSGTCDVQRGAKCSGTCRGKCDGKCKGKCEGVASRGVCAGTCDGTCTGACTGSCELRAKSSCNGTCTGACDAEMKTPSCVAEIAASRPSPACDARCNARAAAKATCTRARVGVTIKGANKTLAKNLKAALENDLPLVLQVSSGMRPRLEKLASEMKSLLEEAQSLATGPLAACVSAPLRDGVDAAASIESSTAKTASIAVALHMP
ncbi:MAG TPA: hypothetical protein VGH28_33340 [Polyangiaceae bacterium]|jgi:hypothetical protein